jgi:hypothetical protein
MTTHTFRHAFIRLGSFTTLGAVVLLAACDRRLPTSAEIDAMDVAGAERVASQARVFHMVWVPSVMRHFYYVDGVKATPAEARALPGNVILSMRLMNFIGSGDSTVMHITTDGTRQRDPAYEAAEVRRWVAKGEEERVSDSVWGQEAIQAEIAAVEAEARRTAGPSSAGRMVRTRTASFDGVVVIDGIVSSSAALVALNPMRIVETEVLKGRAAMKESSDPKAAYGIIRVTTRK